MRTLRTVGLALLCFVFPSAVHAQTAHLTAEQAKDHVGENATVCGKVVDSHYASRSRGEPTFLNLDKRYPDQIFTIVVWGSDRPKFGDPEAKYGNKDVCVTGKITSYRGVPETTAHDPDQIEIRE